MNVIVFEREIISVREIITIKTGRDIDIKTGLKFSKDPYTKAWEINAYKQLKEMGCDEGIIWRAIKGRYDLERGGQRLLRRHLAIVDQTRLLQKIWNIIK